MRRSVRLSHASGVVLAALVLFGLAACATTRAPAGPDQPALAQMAARYVDALRAVGITRMSSSATSPMVELDTYYGTVYIRYPADMQPVAFVLELRNGWLSASAPSFDAARDQRTLAALVPEAVRVTIGSNDLGYARANPWH